VAGVLVIVARPATAAVGVAVSAQSDDVFRGTSLSGGRPVASLDLAFDHPSGFYAGATATGVLAAHSGPRGLSLQEYVGFARRLAPELVADAGVSHSDYTEYYVGRDAARYSEVYVGLASRHLAARLSYSPRYFGYRRETLYGELEATVRPRPEWRLSAHAGVLGYLTGASPPGASDTIFDWRFSASREVRGLALQLAVTGREGEAGGPAARRPKRQAVVFGVSHSF